MGPARPLPGLTRLVVLGLLMVLVTVAARHETEPGRSADAPRRTQTLERVAGSACADQLLLLAPGAHEGTTTRPVSEGRTLAGVRAGYLAAVSGQRSVEVRVVDWATPALSMLGPARRTARSAVRFVTRDQALRWTAGSATVVARTVADLQRRAVACPDQDLVLAGYAQGALVVHRTLLALRSDAALLRRVAGVLLVSDPDRPAGTTATLAGSPLAGRDARGVVNLKVARVADVAGGGLAGKVTSVCARGDISCDLRSVSVRTARAVAASYATGTQAARLRGTATSLGARSTRVPRPSPAVTQVSAPAGSTVARPLAAKVYAADRAALRWSTASALPPGLTLSSTGVLAGRPTTPGRWTIDYAVRNTVSAAYSRPVPGQVVVTIGPAPDATAPLLGAGGQDSCAVSAGTLTCWGLNVDGQVGDGTRTNRPTPTAVAGTDWASVSTSGSHACAITTAGALSCWGANDLGQLGDGTRTTRTTPVRIGTAAWRSVSTSWNSTCGVTTGGAAYCWGLNDDGQLGTGSRTLRTTPGRVGTTVDWVSVSAGGFHGCGVRTSGQLWCWGANDQGQLGDGTRTTRLVPTLIGTATTWSRVSASWFHTCATTTTGFALCWGLNDQGQLGDGTRTARLVPTNVAGGLGPWTGVGTGNASSCGLRQDGTAYCWGDDSEGRLGNGTTTASLRPTPVAGLTGVVELVVGLAHACALSTPAPTDPPSDPSADPAPAAALSCWGSDDAGQLGSPGGAASTPAAVARS